MSSLFIIGNGFDLAHGVPTKYSNFRDFLVTEYGAYEDISLFPPDINIGNHGEEIPDSTEVSSLVTRLLLNANIEDDWCDFEEKLGKLDYNEFYDLIEDFDSDDEENPFIIAYKMEDISSSLLNSIPYIQKLFCEWINTIQIKSTLLPKQSFKGLLMPESDAILNFNYTLILEKLYGCKNVCHIHGKKGDEILVGHGDDSDKVGRFDRTKFPGAICSLTDVKRALRKNTNIALLDNHEFFESLSVVDKIYSIGFSYGPVDLIYIQKICNKINSNSTWIFNNYCGDREKLQSFKEIVQRCGFTGLFKVQKLL